MWHAKKHGSSCPKTPTPKVRLVLSVSAFLCARRSTSNKSCMCTSIHEIRHPGYGVMRLVRDYLESFLDFTPRRSNSFEVQQVWHAALLPCSSLLRVFASRRREYFCKGGVPGGADRSASLPTCKIKLE